MSSHQSEAVIIGSGPNGLAAAIELARQGVSVRVIEAHKEIGGGTRTAELTLPGFTHDVCSAVHPMGILSPFFRQLPLEEHGLTWVLPQASVAHPMPDREAVMLYRSLDQSAEGLGPDARAYRQLVGPFIESAHELLADVMAPLRIPSHPVQMLRFGVRAIFSANRLARLCFRAEAARALLAGCAGHSVLPLTQPLTAALGLLFAITGHVEDLPIAKGGSSAVSKALGSYLESLGGKIETGRRVENLDEFRDARAILFDTSPASLIEIAGSALPGGYRRRLGRYRYEAPTFAASASRGDGVLLCLQVVAWLIAERMRQQASAHLR